MSTGGRHFGAVGPSTSDRHLSRPAPNAPASEIFADNYFNGQAAHDADEVDIRDLQAYLAIIDEFHGAFSDATVTIHSQIAERDMVATRWVEHADTNRRVPRHAAEPRRVHL